jgi:hypothetical protein
MTKIQAIVFAVLCGATPAIWGPALAAQTFDGTWSVEVVTEKGTCDQAYRWDIVIRDGRIATAPDMPASGTGTVSQSGSVNVNFSRGSDTLSARGTASGKWATGVWNAPTKGCAGRWRAERRA